MDGNGVGFHFAILVSIYSYNTIVKTKQSKNLVLIGHQLITLKNDKGKESDIYPAEFYFRITK